ncbi:MAG TPA: DUF488 domain-containing protein [Planctomycetota bacterium]|nr:DUF488 domain-containing protein [Planctomycetota bacterium]
MIRIKRTYEPRNPKDGRRILVERLWPRGMKKEALALNAWMKEVAPSPRLREWFGHRPERWNEFRRRYQEELDAKPLAWVPLLKAAGRSTVTLLYSARDTLHNGAIVLRDYLSERRPGGPDRRRPRGASQPPSRAPRLRKKKRQNP